MADVIRKTGGTGTFPYYDWNICNMALSRIGNADNYVSSSSLTSNTTKEDRLCNLWYPHVLRMTLMKLPWKCATVRDEIVCDGETEPGMGFDYQYAIPSDCLIINDVSDEEVELNQDLEWKREGQYILTDAYDKIYLTYVTADNTTDEQDQQFLMLLIAWLAYAIAPSLIASEQTLKRLEMEWRTAMLMATGIENKEGYAEPGKDRWDDAGRISVSNRFSPAVHD